MPPTKAQTRALAERLRGDNFPFGHNWVDRFTERHPSINMKVASNIEAARARECTEENLFAFYDRISDIIREKSIRRNRIYNVDETGFQEGESDHKMGSRVNGNSLRGDPSVSTGGSTSWATW